MADAKKPTKKAEEVKDNTPLGLNIIIFLLIIFVIWVFTNGNKKDIKTESFMNTKALVPETPTAR
jgi:hypothetical protein